MSQFQKDLAAAKPAEALVRQVLSKLTDKYLFTDVADNPKFYDYGDIAAIGEDFKVKFFEVKNDSRIADTKNILCEELVYDKRNDREAPGNMCSKYDYYCVVSQKENRIYILDFKELQKIYKKGEFRIFDHATQYTEGYLLPLCVAKKYHALLAQINYETGEVKCF
jgi:hypothetical protein